ncbi:hypothetical protein [Pseudobacteroides cellulosolvens]|uniref:Uncharacterized protein n=1 Tax=Pseudobacteroides cellulosolvens ATCC 35603 = DSM 2933 TaxID=398512 RepID=A0A0L6JXH2_9FIRM|nr:hypothetical protein [Pseudobacteroides cellulosolvens]KNY30558.1 hypothetical protein Bccel_5838 [Pseudobacteroides cellulosolvens ATCC 35603 = DSM 2933]
MDNSKIKPENIIVMKVGPHSNMSLSEIIKTKQEEETIHGVHYWGYSGVLCQPKKAQEFCRWSLSVSNQAPRLILIETQSSYISNIGAINYFSSNGNDFEAFSGPVQLQGAQFAFVSRKLKKVENFALDDYLVVGGKNDGKPLSLHLRYRVNKSFARIKPCNFMDNKGDTVPQITVLEAELVYPYAIWLES